MEKTAESQIRKQVVFFCKPFLFKFLNTIKFRNVSLQYILEGAGALEFWITNPDVVQTLDADVHLWLEREWIGLKKDQFLLEDFQKAFDHYFNNEVMKYNQGVFRYFDYMTKWDKPRVTYKPRWDVTSSKIQLTPTLLLMVYGFDLADLVYDNSYATRRLDAYCYTFFPKDRGHRLNVLKVEYYLFAQIRILYQNAHMTLLKKKVMEQLGMAPEKKFDGPFFGHPQTVALCLPWFKSLCHYFRAHRDREWNDRQKKRGAVEKMTERYLTDVLLDKKKMDTEQQKRIRLRYKRSVEDRKNRCRKVISRLFIILEYFHVVIKNNEIVLEYKTGFTSCAIFNARPDVDPSLHCQRKIEFGKPPQSRTDAQNRLLRQSTALQQIRDPRIDSKTECIHKIRRTADVKENIRGLVQMNQAICRWTTLSSELTAECTAFYFTAMLGFPYEWSPGTNRVAIENIQRMLSVQKPAFGQKTITVRKTARYLIYNPNRTSKNLQVGDSVFQYVFNATCINPSFGNYLQFAGYQTGTCGYIIEVPPSIPYLYIGDRFGGTANEFEVLLPLGIQFRILSINEDAYVMQDNQWTRLTTYTVRAEWPDDTIRAAVMPKDDKINWRAYQAWIQNHASLNTPIQVFEGGIPASEAQIVPFIADKTSTAIKNIFSKAGQSIPMVKKGLTIIVISIAVLSTLFLILEAFLYLLNVIVLPATAAALMIGSAELFDKFSKYVSMLRYQSIQKWVKQWSEYFLEKKQKPKIRYDTVPTLPPNLLPVGTLVELHAGDEDVDLHSLSTYARLYRRRR